MNFSTSAHCGSLSSKENIPPSSKTDAVLVPRAKLDRSVLAVLSENEQRGRSCSQGSQFSKHSSISDSSQLTFFGCPSSSSYDVFVEEACEVVLAASGQEVVSGRYHPDSKSANLQSEDLRFLLELSSTSCQDASLQSDESLTPDEMRFRPKPGYLEKHPEITNGMRVILVDWMVEVVQEYRLRSQTLHLAVNYLDRFLSCTTYVKRGKLQLVGTAALLIAAKYEEIFPPQLNEFVDTTDRTYTKKQLVRMEHVFLRVLAFRMTVPTVNQFLRLFVSIHSVCGTEENLALYVAELSLLEIDPFLEYRPSILAAGAYCLATYTVNKSLWPDSLHAFTGYTIADIVPCLTDLHKLYISAETRPQQAIREKYKSSKYCRVSLITPPAVLPFP
uniref:cyclin-A1 isoform X2 n=1 Tax=Scatophagus argus TaxID=75038 RepID=UPI001ED826F0|nr:cyclin-A1 isoform X2 [Scatophagus argus]